MLLKIDFPTCNQYPGSPAVIFSVMSLRPRPGPVRSENGNYQRVETDSIDSRNNLKQNNFRRYARLALIGILAVGAAFLLVFHFGSIGEKTLIKKENTAKSVKKMDLAVHWAGSPVTLTKDGDLDADACILLSQCFKSAHFVPDPIKFPKNPYKTCHATLRNILRAFDSGFYFDGPRLVGFISSDYENYGTFSQVSLYNVCVRKEERGKGIAKAMVPEYIKSVVAKRTPKNIPRIYIGLDVDFDTESAVGAFALYAKMGFNRWWEPCSSISQFDFNKMERQLSMANPEAEPGSDPKLPSFVFPMTQLMLRRKESLVKQIYDTKGGVFTHFCMVMLMGADDFGSVGVDIKSAVQNALKSQSKN